MREGGALDQLHQPGPGEEVGDAPSEQVMAPLALGVLQGGSGPSVERIRLVDMNAYNVLCDELLEGMGLETPKGELPDERNARLWSLLLDDEYFQAALKTPQIIPHMTMRRLKLVHLLDLLESYRSYEMDGDSEDARVQEHSMKFKRIECLSKALDIFCHEILEENQLNSSSFVQLFVEFKSQILLIQLELGVNPSPRTKPRPYGKIQAVKFVTKSFQEVPVDSIFGMDAQHRALLCRELSVRMTSVINGINRGEISKTQEQMIEFENHMCAFLANVFNEMNQHDLPYLHPMYEIHQLQLRNLAEEMDSYDEEEEEEEEEIELRKDDEEEEEGEGRAQTTRTTDPAHPEGEVEARHADRDAERTLDHGFTSRQEEVQEEEELERGYAAGPKQGSPTLSVPRKRKGEEEEEDADQQQLAARPKSLGVRMRMSDMHEGSKENAGIENY